MLWHSTAHRQLAEPFKKYWMCIYAHNSKMQGRVKTPCQPAREEANIWSASPCGRRRWRKRATSKAKPEVLLSRLPCCYMDYTQRPADQARFCRNKSLPSTCPATTFSFLQRNPDKHPKADAGYRFFPKPYLSSQLQPLMRAISHCLRIAPESALQARGKKNDLDRSLFQSLLC